jgi:hypothetical protein
MQEINCAYTHSARFMFSKASALISSSLLTSISRSRSGSSGFPIGPRLLATSSMFGGHWNLVIFHLIDPWDNLLVRLELASSRKLLLFPDKLAYVPDAALGCRATIVRALLCAFTQARLETAAGCCSPRCTRARSMLTAPCERMRDERQEE